MANKKFSEFTLKTDPANVDFLVGYDGSDNVRIDPSNLGGGGASDLNGLSDVSVDLSSDNAFLINTSPYANLTSGTKNLIIGEGAGNALRNSASGNICVGYNAGSINQLGSGGVAIGNSSATTSGGIKNGFVAIGENSGASDYGVCLGYYANGLAAGGSGIVAISFQAARFNTADYHISIGHSAGFSQTSGAQNTNLGYEAGYSNTTNAFRTCVGYQAGKLNTGTGNTFIGQKAGGSRANSEGHSTAVGNAAGRYWESGSNTALGENAGQYANGTSRYNVMVGREALGGAFGSKSNNVAVGYKSGWAATTGGNNVFVGYEAGVAHTTAQQSTIIGYHAGLQITTANNNTLIGHQAGVAVTGAENTLIGTFCGRTLTSGTTNTMVGVGYNGGGVTTGSNNTLIGNAAAATSTSVSNEITLGNSSVTSLRCAVTSITSLSDERDKSEIKDLEYGLAFIDALQPREFVWDNRPETTVEVDEDGNETEVEFYSANKGKKDFGFIAQEVRELDNDTLRLVYSENEERLELSYGKLVPILVKAIQELKEEVELLKS